MDGASIIGAATLPNSGTSWHVIGAGDFNGARECADDAGEVAFEEVHWNGAGE
jgi:hypothetical protein